MDVTFTIYERNEQRAMQMVATGEPPRCGVRFNGEEVLFSSNRMRQKFINHYKPLKANQGVRVQQELFDLPPPAYPSDPAFRGYHGADNGHTRKYKLSNIDRNISKIVKVFDKINTVSMAESMHQLSRAIETKKERHRVRSAHHKARKARKAVIEKWMKDKEAETEAKDAEMTAAFKVKSEVKVENVDHDDGWNPYEEDNTTAEPQIKQESM